MDLTFILEEDYHARDETHTRQRLLDRSKDEEVLHRLAESIYGIHLHLLSTRQKRRVNNLLSVTCLYINPASLA
jgi:hypothetical protein